MPIVLASCSLAVAILSLGVCGLLAINSRPVRLLARVVAAEEIAAAAMQKATTSETIVAGQLEALDTLADQVERKRRSITAAASRLGTLNANAEHAGESHRDSLRRRAATLQ